MNKRPLSVVILGCVYMVVGTIGFATHIGDFQKNAFQYDGGGVEFIRLLAVVCGAFLLKGHNWARWGTVAWIGFHVILSAFHSLPQFVIHCAFCAVIAWFLFRPGAERYFRGAPAEPV